MKYIGEKESWKKAGIYLISNTLDDRKYVGSTNCFRERFRSHRNKLKVGKNASLYLQRFCSKYGIDKLEFSILEIVNDTSKLLEREEFYLRQLKPEFNLMLTPLRVKGYKHTEQTKKMMSRKAKESYKKGRNSWNKGRKLTNEQKKSFKECSKGIPRIANKVPVCLYDFDGITLIRCYESGTDAVKDTGTPMSSIFSNISGVYKTTKSGIWKRKD